MNKCDDTDGCANSPCFASADGLYSSACLDEAAPNTGFTRDVCPDGFSSDGIATGGTCTDINDCGVDQCGPAAAGSCADTGVNEYGRMHAHAATDTHHQRLVAPAP